MKSVYTIPCAHCGAKAGKRCANTFTGAPREEAHKTRYWHLNRQTTEEQS